MFVLQANYRPEGEALYVTVLARLTLINGNKKKSYFRGSVVHHTLETAEPIKQNAS
jgi:hypothetical protein